MSSPCDTRAQEHLYDEINAALGACDGSNVNGWGDPSLLPRLALLNSACREALRLFPLSCFVSDKKVVHKDGLTLPSGQFLARGSYLGLPILEIHLDENIYANAATYQPFRFCSRQPGEPPMASDESAGHITSNPVVNITDTFLSFGTGKDAW